MCWSKLKYRVHTLAARERNNYFTIITIIIIIIILQTSFYRSITPSDPFSRSLKSSNTYLLLSSCRWTYANSAPTPNLKDQHQTTTNHTSTQTKTQKRLATGGNNKSITVNNLNNLSPQS